MLLKNINIVLEVITIHDIQSRKLMCIALVAVLTDESTGLEPIINTL